MRTSQICAIWKAVFADQPGRVKCVMGSQLPSMVLPWLYGLAVTGQYSLAQRVLWQPIVFVGQAVYQVCWCNAARLFNLDPTPVKKIP